MWEEEAQKRLQHYKEGKTGTIFFEEAKSKVAKAIQGIEKNNGIEIDEAFAKVLGE